MHAFIRFSDSVSRLCGVVSMLLLAAAVVVVCEMVFVRYALRSSTVWQTEFVIYSLVAATFIGSPYVLLHRGHVGVDLIPNLLHGRARFAIELIAALLSIAFCAVLAWSGWNYFHEALTRGWRTDTVWALPLWIPLLPLPLGIGALVMQYAAEIAKMATGSGKPGAAE
ncbi:MAG: TRAP transporter small permease [Flavobacteriaceae bacterium]